ncbi:MAG TPA: hypothetical protein VG604_02540 [Candidatus Saccharimonadales bacterium]|nr:hypothetical protein [Candidatus Saccharimonadales bacterium]
MNPQDSPEPTPPSDAPAAPPLPTVITPSGQAMELPDIKNEPASTASNEVSIPIHAAAAPTEPVVSAPVLHPSPLKRSNKSLKPASVLDSGKKNPFKGHIARPKDVPLAKPEYTAAEAAAAHQIAQASGPAIQPADAQAGGETHAYAFITEPGQPAKQSAMVTSSMPQRIAVVLGGVLVLIIIAVLLKGMLAGGKNLTGVVAVVQDQQEMLHILNNATQQQGISGSNLQFVVTAQASLGSSQSALFTYLNNNHFIIKPQQLALKISTTTDKELATAAANTTYNQTFQQVMQLQLGTYTHDLKLAYDQSGPNGKALLNDDYNQAQLLAKLLNQTAGN